MLLKAEKTVIRGIHLLSIRRTEIRASPPAPATTLCMYVLATKCVPETCINIFLCHCIKSSRVYYGLLMLCFTQLQIANQNLNENPNRSALDYKY